MFRRSLELLGFRRFRQHSRVVLLRLICCGIKVHLSEVEIAGGGGGSGGVGGGSGDGGGFDVGGSYDEFLLDYKLDDDVALAWRCWWMVGLDLQPPLQPWCKRIIWASEVLKQLLYTRSETQDHRPVKSMLSTEVKVSRVWYESHCFSAIYNYARQVVKGGVHYALAAS